MAFLFWGSCVSGATLDILDILIQNLCIYDIIKASINVQQHFVKQTNPFVLCLSSEEDGPAILTAFRMILLTGTGRRKAYRDACLSFHPLLTSPHSQWLCLYVLLLVTLRLVLFARCSASLPSCQRLQSQAPHNPNPALYYTASSGPLGVSAKALGLPVDRSIWFRKQGNDLSNPICYIYWIYLYHIWHFKIYFFRVILLG